MNWNEYFEDVDIDFTYQYKTGLVTLIVDPVTFDMTAAEARVTVFDSLSGVEDFVKQHEHYLYYNCTHNKKYNTYGYGTSTRITPQ